MKHLVFIDQEEKWVSASACANPFPRGRALSLGLGLGLGLELELELELMPGQDPLIFAHFGHKIGLLCAHTGSCMCGLRGESLREVMHFPSISWTE
jgi:hypothetical protein